MVANVLRLVPAEVEVQCESGATILEAALDAGYFPRHSCRKGECLACESRLVSGEVRYPDGVDVGAVRPGHCLTCIAMPIGDVVVEALGVCATPGRPVVKTGGRVLSVDRVSGDVSVVQLQLPPDSGFRFAPGQYIDVVLRDGTRRSYSMANQPGEDGHVELHVRAVPGGRFSQHVYQRLKPRDLLRVEGPFGSFLLNPTRLPVVLVASGTGYAPIASFLRSHHDALQARGVAFYWGGHREADLYAIDEMRRWEATSENFRFVPVLSSPEDSWRGRTGFVHLAVQEDIPDLSAFEVYACGNPLMIEAARTSFVAKSGLAPDRFFSDAFVIAAPAASRA